MMSLNINFMDKRDNSLKLFLTYWILEVMKGQSADEIFFLNAYH